MQQVDGMASVIFRSLFSQVGKRRLALTTYFSQYALCDALVRRVGGSRDVASTDMGDWECTLR